MDYTKKYRRVKYRNWYPDSYTYSYEDVVLWYIIKIYLTYTSMKNIDILTADIKNSYNRQYFQKSTTFSMTLDLDFIMLVRETWVSMPYMVEKFPDTIYSITS